MPCENCTCGKKSGFKYDNELIEILADVEHTRWSGWQAYLHSKCTKNEDGSLTIPAESVKWWKSEIDTPYSKLTERQKESDRTEARRTIKAIIEYLK